jgi:phytoene dehydrogenase-like protein
MNGYNSQVFELHNLPGGLCTAWERRDYVLDGCLTYLFGSGAGQPFNQALREIGAVQGRNFYNHAELVSIIAADGRTLHAYADPDRLEAHMCDLSPTDAGRIRAFCQGIRLFTTFDLSLLQQQPRDLMGLLDWARLGLRMLPFAPTTARYAIVSAREFAAGFRDPFLRRAVPQMFAWPDVPVMAGLSLLAYMHTGNAGYPAGGSLALARAVESRYLALGGVVHYNAQVEKILVEDDRAVGVRLYNDQVHHADAVISTADGRCTIFDLLHGVYADRGLRARYDGHLPLYPQVQVSLGLRRDMSGTPPWTVHLLDDPVLIAGEDRRDLSVHCYGFDPSLAPPGKSVVTVTLPTHYGFWQHIYGRKLYDSEQVQLAGIVLDLLERFYPGIRADVEVTDVATPLSYERYTGNWQGSSCGWLLTKGTLPMLITGLGKRLPGLKGFYMAGQWVEPGGSVPVAAMSGRNAIQLLCHDEGRPFIASEP